MLNHSSYNSKRFFKNFNSSNNFPDDVENLLVHHPRINKLVVFLIQYRPSSLGTLQSKLQPIENYLDDIEGLLDVLNKIELVGEIEEEILLQVYKSEICDLNKLLDGCSWLKGNKSLIMKIIQHFGGKYFQLGYLSLLFVLIK